MDDHFHLSKTLPKEKMLELMKKSDSPALVRFVALYALYLGACAWAVTSWDRVGWELILSQLSLGIICCSFFAALHETAHNTAFRSTALNKTAAVLAGAAHAYSPTMFRELHFTHHRHTHVPGRDPEISLGSRPAPSVVRGLPMYFAWLTGLPLLMFKIGMLINGAIGMPAFMRKRLYPFVRSQAQVRMKLALESIFILSLYAGIALLALYVYPGFWAILTGLLFGHCLLASYLAAEHNGLPHGRPVLECTRSMRTNQLVKLLMWNMPYHAEHHAYPAVPFHALPRLHLELRDEIPHKDLSYPGFHLNVLRRKITQRT